MKKERGANELDGVGEGANSAPPHETAQKENARA